MKLKDILKTDTDNKGWLKVFKKLGADAEMLKYVNENISKSGGGGDTELFYYKWKEGADKSNGDFSRFINIVSCLKNWIHSNRLFYKEFSMGNELTTDYIISNCDAFCVYDYTYNLYDNPSTVITKGTIVERISALDSNIIDAESKEYFILLFNQNIEQITKEEYESLITQ